MGLLVKLDPDISLRSVFVSLFAGSKVGSLETPSPSSERLQASFTDVEGWLSIKLRTGKCSRLLKEQLALHNLSLGEIQGGLRYYFQPYDVFSVIEDIENNRQRSDKPFTGGLRGLYHAHHSTASFIAENAVRNWDRKVKQSGLTEHDYLEKVATELLVDRMARGMSQDEASKDLMAEIGYKELLAGVDGPFHKTGEWLIFAKEKGVNYFLTLAFHTEGDTKILQKLAPCFQEFQFLRSIVGFPKEHRT